MPTRLRRDGMAHEQISPIKSAVCNQSATELQLQHSARFPRRASRSGFSAHHDMQKTTKKPPAKVAGKLDGLKDELRSSGLRSTAPRLAVLQQLLSSKSPLSHADLADQLESQGLERATVYRNLMDLAEAGIVTRSELGDHVWRYEVRRQGHAHDSKHPHFVCVDCGEVSCLNEVKVDISPAPGSKKSVIGSLTEVLLKGHCGKCT